MISTADIVGAPISEGSLRAGPVRTQVVSMNARIVVSTAEVCQFQKDRDEQARCEFKYVVSMNVRIVIDSVDIIAMKVCQFQKDRDEQAWCEFKCVVSMAARNIIDAADIVALKVCQFQKDRYEQARTNSNVLSQ